MHVRRQLNRFFGSLRRKEAVKNKLDNLSDNEFSEGQDTEKRKEGKRLTFHNLSLRLKRKHKENSLSRCQLLNVDDEEEKVVDAKCQQEQETNAAEFYAYDASSSVSRMESSLAECLLYKGPHYLCCDDDDFPCKKQEKEGGEEKDIYQDDIKESASAVGAQPKFLATTTSDMEMDLRHALETNDRYPETEERKQGGEIINVLPSHSSSLAENEASTFSGSCCYCNCGDMTEATTNVAKKKKANFRGGVRKSVRSVKKAFQDGFVAWGHSMTYASAVMPSFYECPATVSALDPCGYYSNTYNYAYDFRDTTGGEKTLNSQRLKNNYSLQCSHPSHHSQLAY